MNASALQIALAWAARGFRILPLDPTSKVPLLPETAATTSETRIRHWGKQRPYAVPGIVVAGKVEPITSLPAPVAEPPARRSAPPSSGDEVLAAALDFARRKMPVFPCNPSPQKGFGKRPLVAGASRPGAKDGGFYLATTDPNQIGAWWSRWQNALIGLRIGPASGVWALDPDAPDGPGEPDGEAALEQLEAIHGLLPSTHTHHTPGGGRHLLFACDDSRPIRCSSGSLPAGIHVRGEGGYIIAPPSILTDGRSYRLGKTEPFIFANAPDWLYDLILQPRAVPKREPLKFNPPTAPTLIGRPRLPEEPIPAGRRAAYLAKVLESEVARVATAAPRGRNNALNVAALKLGHYVGPDGFDESVVVSCLTNAAAACGLTQDDGPNSVAATIASGLTAGMRDPADLPKDLRRLAITPPYGAARPNGDARPNGAAGAAPTAPFDLRELWNPWREPAVPPFPLDTLPATIRNRVEERAETTGSDPAAFAMASLAGLSGVIDHRVTVKPKEYDEYRVRPNFWVLLVGRPSVRKSTPIDDIGYFLRKADQRDDDAHKNAIKLAEQAEQDAAELPPRQRVITNATSEALVELLSQQDCGCILLADEMAGWIGAMDKYTGGGKGAAAERSVWIQAHGGVPYSQHRIKGRRTVRNLSCSILAAVQPDRLREMGRLESDGLLQRFLPMLMRDTRPGQDRPKSPTIIRDYATLLERAGSIAPQDFLLSPEAREFYFQLEEETIRALASNDAFGSFCGKQPRTLLVLALLLHVCEVVEGRAGLTDVISGKLAERADRTVREFLIPHARVFYDSIDDRLSNEHRQIAAAICKHLGPTITLRELTRATRAMQGLDSPAEVQKKIFPFIAGGWLRPELLHPANNVWQVTPGIGQHFADEVKAHLAWEAQIRDSIRASGAQRDAPARSCHHPARGAEPSDDSQPLDHSRK